MWSWIDVCFFRFNNVVEPSNTNKRQLQTLCTFEEQKRTKYSVPEACVVICSSFLDVEIVLNESYFLDIAPFCCFFSLYWFFSGGRSIKMFLSLSLVFTRSIFLWTAVICFFGCHVIWNITMPPFLFIYIYWDIR